ncbi:MAG: AMIN domain-containing protein, partial [Thalassotalea sp.]|nr:AMIN domain-containing protein [Thalassotalea sp.]
MAERYIFNKSLNRRAPRWYWLAFAVAAIFSFTVFVSPVKAQEPLLVDPDAKQNASTATTTVTNIDFTQAANNTAVTLVSFEGKAPKVQLIESQGKVSLTLPNTKLGEDQLVELNVADFGTLVSTIETFEDKNGSRIEVKYSGPVTVQNTVKDGTIRLAIAPMNSAQQEALEAEKKYTGDPISLDFQDVPVRQVLQIIAQVNGFNLVTTDTV